jgi:hypothetical protein
MTNARATAMATAVVAVVLPASAWALCPNCLGQSRNLGTTLTLVGGFLLVPFLVAYVAQRVIRRVCRQK